ncbi:hypothetical protein G5V57_29725 [Nordella sp. HKS 07]|uniref:hypothetical protein n=1 Tax=Nordella sp. HKS 07 TaxID=2712222 RepID=UPI0013E192F8|nr:hypothetical protein [Nordella sp. HKS 07]QIG51526.1 hypothetical protein G5V57_29725 [Nordella sp. HKS 07]
MTSKTPFGVIVFRVVSLMWTMAVIGVASVTGGFIFVFTTSLVLIVIGIFLVLFIGIGALKLLRSWIRVSLPSEPEETVQSDNATTSRTRMKWRKLSLGELLTVQAVIAILFGYLLVSQFPKVPLVSACIVSIVLALVGTLLVKLAIGWMRNPIEIFGLDLWRNIPDDKQGSE